MTKGTRSSGLGFPGVGTAVALLLLTGCGADRRETRGAFTATGRVIAFSGGEGGARQACFTCHGLNGEGSATGVPRLAGLDQGYLVKQLGDYATERRPHTAMSAIAKDLDQDDRLAVSAYYAELPFAAAPAEALADLTGARLYHLGDSARGLRSCASCHGTSGEGRGAANPALHGQPSAYLADQLVRWKEASRRNDPQNLMLTISRRLTDAETAAVSAYASGLPGPGSPATATPAASPPERRPYPRSDASAPLPRAWGSTPGG